MYGWRKTVTLEPLVVLATAACLCGVPGSAPGASARDAERDYGVDYVPPSQPNRTEGTRAPDEAIVAKPPMTPQTLEERRLEFEREYGIQHRSRSWFFSMLQSVKYGLDKISFTAKETARRLEFTYDFGSPTGPSGMTRKPQYSLPLFGTFGHPQLKSVLTEHDPQTGTPFVGLKLAIPFGQGGSEGALQSRRLKTKPPSRNGEGEAITASPSSSL